MNKKKLKLEWMLERGHDFNDPTLIKLLDENFSSILIRTSTFFPDPWAIAHKYASITDNLNFIIAVNPMMMNPVYCAIKIVTFQKMYGNRVSINVVSGASTVEQAAYGDSFPISFRYKRSAEYAKIIKQLVVTGKIDSFNGNFYNLSDVEMESGNDFEIVFAGSSDNTIDLANNLGTAHYYAMETLPQYIENRHKIFVESAIKSTIIVNENSDKAWEFANNLIKDVTEDDINKLKIDLSSHESQNQKHQQSLHNFSKDNLIVDKNIWAGFGLLRGGGITAMVGNNIEVANLIEKFYINGLDRLLIGGTPELLFANNFISGIIPLLEDRNII
jgi:alkanesulfonate monooxygenase